MADFELALSASADLYLAIYPSTVLMKLRMPLQKRLALCAALGMGSMYVNSQPHFLDDSWSMPVPRRPLLQRARSSQTLPCRMTIHVRNLELPFLLVFANNTRWNRGSCDVDKVRQPESFSTTHANDFSIESNVLILASCIPTLQPILELTLRGHVHTRSPRGKDANYPRDSVFQRTGHRTIRRSDRSITHVESQESILGAEERKNSHPLGAIVRTDDVSVEFNTRSGHSMPERHMTWQIA